MTKTEFYSQLTALESRALLTTYKAWQHGRFRQAWEELNALTVDQMSSLISRYEQEQE